MRTRQFTAVATLSAAALLLTACGGSPLDDKTGSEVADAAADALEEAGSVHVAGEIDQDGEEGSVDLFLQGEDATGSITMEGSELQLISVDGQFYLQGGADFWESAGLPEEATSLLEGQWVIVPPDSASEFETFTFADIVDSLRNPESEVKDEVESDEVDGEDVVVVEQEDGSRLSVADEDPTYPLRLEDEANGSTLTLSRFGEEEDITAPDDALDLEELAGGA
jgi:hypothetical protein